ncbi:hypothetical protein QBA54_48715 [Streptomyces sp. B21-108]|uniref:hypothetical protein n=1 Tax=Streptomyces sp. B21-108 TaxID=3039419 RepID=UPI002FEFB9EB
MSAEGHGGAAQAGPVHAGALHADPAQVPRRQPAERDRLGPPGAARYADRDRADERADGESARGDRDGSRDDDGSAHDGRDPGRDGRGDRAGGRAGREGQGSRDAGRGDRGEGAGGAEDRDEAAERARAEWEERQRREGERFREAMRDPVAADGAAGGAGGARAANRSRSEGRARFTVRGNGSVFDRSRFGHAHFGDVHVGAGDRGSAVLGEVPEEELARLSSTFRAPEGYRVLKEALREHRVLVVVGAPGTGRRTTALCLLEQLTGAVRKAGRPTAGTRLTIPTAPDGDTRPDEGDEGEGDAVPDGDALPGKDTDTDLTPGQVTRLDVSSLGHILRDPATVARRVAPGGGFVLHLPDAPGDWTPPSEAHLDALATALARRDAYAVLVASPSTPAGPLLTGRHALRCPSVPAPELLSWHLTRRLADAPGKKRNEQGKEGKEGKEADPETLDRGERILRHPLLRQALGIPLDRLRPAETDALAALVVRHLRGELTRAELLDRCGDMARAQVQAWFADARHRPTATDRADEAARALLRQAAFRVALAVLDGEAFSAVADAADLLARELLTARTPGQEPGRLVFAEDWDGLLAAARAEFGESEDESLAGVPLPVRTVRYQGEAFAGAVLAEVWQSHHAARAPIVRWLRALADDPRPQVWVRAALAAGELSTADPGYGFVELVSPLACARSARRRYAAATALDQAGRREPYRTAVRAVVEEWAHADEAGLRWTAALALGHGRIEPDTRTAVELLGRLGVRDEGRHLQVASYALARLAAGSRAAETLTLLGEWAVEAAGDRRELSLLTGVRLCIAPCDDYWEPEGAGPDLDPQGDRRDGDAGGVGGSDDVADGVAADPDGEPGDGGTAPVEPSGPPRKPRRPGRVGMGPSTGRAAGIRIPGLWRTVPGRPAVPRADVAAVDAELGRLRDWPLALAIAVTVPEAAGPLAALLWRVFDSHLSGERALDGLSSWLRAAEQDAASAAGGELLRALVWFLPLLVREERDWQRLTWVLEALAAEPGEPMDARFVGHVLDAVGAGLRGRGGEQP